MWKLRQERSRARAMSYAIERDTIGGNRAGVLVVCGLTVVTIFVMSLVPPVSQHSEYHQFADVRSFLGVSNFLNVVSNLGFAIVGILGIAFLCRQLKASAASDKWTLLPYTIFFSGVALTCVWSVYYHLAPSNQRLMWDRLPMSIAF